MDRNFSPSAGRIHSINTTVYFPVMLVAADRVPVAAVSYGRQVELWSCRPARRSPHSMFRFPRSCRWRVTGASLVDPAFRKSPA